MRQHAREELERRRRQLQEEESRVLREAEAKSEALQAHITSLTSRGALQRRLDEGYIRLETIRDTAIARVTPPVPTEADGVLRTASRDTDTRFGPGVPLRVLKR